MPSDLLLIGWDVADWNRLRLMLAKGGMPNLHRLLQRGAAGDLTAAALPDRSTTWTTLLTGKRPARHRVLSDLEPSAQRDRFQAVTRAARQAQALWNIAAIAGKSAHFVNFPATYPAESIANGIIVSDYFFDEQTSDSLHPHQLLAEFAPLVVQPDEIDDRTVKELLGPSIAIPQELLNPFRQFIASAATTQALATRFLENPQCDIAAVRFAGLKLSSPKDELEFAAARFLDLCLGRLLELAGVDSHVAFAVTPTQKFNGLTVLAGPTIRAGHSLGQTNLEDILPTILAILDIPIGADFDGRPCKTAFHVERETKSCVTWEPRGSVIAETPSDDSVVAHLLALGYRDQPDPHADHAIARWKSEQQSRLATAHLEAGDPARALPLLEQSVQLQPRSIQQRSKLAEACFRAGDLNRAKELVEALRADGLDTPLGRAASAAIDIQQGNLISASIHLDRAGQLPGAQPEVLEIIGRLYLRLRKIEPARGLFIRAIQLGQHLPAAHDGLGLADLLDGKFERAEEHLRHAISLAPRASQSHLHLGLVLTKRGRLSEALASLRMAESILPTDPAIHRRLAALLKKSGDSHAAIHHQWLARQHTAFSRQLAGSFDTSPAAQP